MRQHVMSSGSTLAIVVLIVVLLTLISGDVFGQHRQLPPRPQQFEAEDLLASARANGQVSAQPMGGFGDGWSGGAQLLWTGGSPGAVLSLEFSVRQAAMYALELYLTRAPDYAQISVGLDGQISNAWLDTFGPQVARPVPHQAGTFPLSAGVHRLSLRIQDKSPQSSGYLVGLDQIKLYPAGEIPQSERRATMDVGPAKEDAPALMDPGNSATRMGAFPARPPRLAFGAIVLDTNKLAWGPTTQDFDEKSRIRLVWKTDKPEAYQWRWQVASQPFPVDASATPSGLLAEGDAPYKQFTLNLKPYIPKITQAPPPGAKKKRLKMPTPTTGTTETVQSGSTPMVIDTQTPYSGPLTSDKFHIRLIALQAGQLAGVVSNTVIARYQPGVSDSDPDVFNAYNDAVTEKSKVASALAQAKKTFDLEILSFDRAVFPDPNRWGCVRIIKNPYSLQAMHPLASYIAGKEYCPPPNPKYQQKGVWEKYVEGSIKGWMMGWDKLTGYYNSTKAWIATQIANEVPCDWLGEDLEQQCKNAVEQVVGAAISAGLVALGLPPSMPNLEALSEAGKGKIADAAVEFSCQTFEQNGGTCTPEIRAELKKNYKKGLDELQKQLAINMNHQASEPGCGDAAAAKENGKISLPCFTDYPGATVRPASGAVYEPPRVKVRVTRKMAQPPGMVHCGGLVINTWLTNKFEGGYLGGKNLPPAALSGAPYKTASAGIPVLAPGKSIDVLVELNEMQKFNVPGDYTANFHLEPWLKLYLGGKGTLTANVVASVNTGKPSGQGSGYCADEKTWQIQIPQ